MCTPPVLPCLQEIYPVSCELPDSLPLLDLNKFPPVWMWICRTLITKFHVHRTCSWYLDNHSQARNGRSCRVAVIDLGEFAPAITIMVQGLLRCVVALHICGPLRRPFHNNTVYQQFSHYTQHIATHPRRPRPQSSYASPAELHMHNNREKGDYLCKTLEMGAVCRRRRTNETQMQKQ